MMNITQDKVYSALKLILDPELGINIVALGLIYKVLISDDDLGEKVDIEMTLTTPGCPLAPFFMEQVPQVVAEQLGLDMERVTVKFTFDPPWTRDMIDEEALAELGLG